MNISILTGRLTKDPIITRSDKGKTLARFTLAVDREYKKDEADFIQCKAFDKTAELIEPLEAEIAVLDGKILGLESILRKLKH